MNSTATQDPGTAKEQGATSMTARFQTHSPRARIEQELKQLRRRLADAWWYERPLEEIEEIERMIAARAGKLREQA